MNPLDVGWYAAHTLGMKQVCVRLSDELVAWLEQDAHAYGRTVTQSIRFILEQAMEEDTP